VLNAIWQATEKVLATIGTFVTTAMDGSYNLRLIPRQRGRDVHAAFAADRLGCADNEQHAKRHLLQDDSLLVVKFKEEGWVWGGDWSGGSIDASIVQAARVHS